MKRILVAILCLLTVAISLAGCGYDNGRIAYNMKLSKLEKCLEMPKYKGIKVDKSSAEFSRVCGEIIELDISENDLYSKKTEGTVAAGDDIFVDYSAKVDGVALDVAKADNELRKDVGSNPLFIKGSKVEGFDEGLVGAPIGTEFKLNLTFPKSYPDSALAGKPVVFSVKVNYVDEDIALEPQEFFGKLGFKTYELYLKNVEIRSAKKYLIDYVVEKTEIKKYPEDEEKRVYEDFGGVYNNDTELIDQMLEQAGETQEDFESSVMEYYVHPFMDQQMPIYYIFDKEGLTYTPDELKQMTDETLKKCEVYGITKSDLTTEYGSNYFEYLTVKQKVENFLYKNAKIV